jgi:hypothetical protein
MLVQTLAENPTHGRGRKQASTCGLRISDSPTSDNLTPQETTNQDAPDMGADGAGLSCPGSSVVADADGSVARFFQGKMTSSARRSKLLPGRWPCQD